MKNKALFILSPHFGGASRMTINIANLLDKDKFDVKFLVYAPKMDEIINYLPLNADVECLQIRNIWDFATIKLYRIIKKYNATHVFSSFIFMNTRIAMAGNLCGCKVILRNSNYISNFRWIDKFLMKFTYPLADVIITQNEEMHNELIQYVPSINDKTITIHNFFDKEIIDKNLKEESPYSHDNEIRFIWLGRVTKTKGYDVLLKAFKKVHKTIPNAHLYLLGRYENDKFFLSLISYIKAEHISDNVHFLGLLKNPHIWIKHAHCFVLPSRLEGLPNALIEAMYIGTPVVSTTCIPMITRMIDEGVNGYTVPVEDPDKMAEAMINALSLKNCHITYKPSSPDDFKKLF